MMSTVATVFMSVMFAIYMLLGKERHLSQTNRMFDAYIAPGDSLGERKFRGALSLLNENFKKFIIGQCTEAVILGCLCVLGMLILRLPYATTVGTLMAFTALIPIAGAYIGAIVGTLLILPIAPIKALIFLIFIIVLQQIEGNLIYPKVVGNSIGLPGLWVLAAVTIGGGLFGIPGMFLGVPLVAAVYRMLREHIEGNSILVNHRKAKTKSKAKAKPEPEPQPSANE